MLFGSALILAGGLSTRMGYDKKTLKLGGKGVLETLIATLKTLFSEIILSTREPLVNPAVVSVTDERGEGPIAGIYRGLSFCRSSYLYVTACDMPFIDTAYIRYMEEQIRAARPDACVARRKGRYEPFNAFYHKDGAACLLRAIEGKRYGIYHALEEMRLHIIDEDTVKQFNDTMFFNINRQEDLALAETLL
ncbi:MAG: molybdenum cofactor guanylyltransferase [Spirochaetaceae bacterium]|jgi:molybdopterin-guanine dinucleotide biosynthesis protein A|nr:molybdenum cofactor guanylyltransferase [Spirochaetaceae bacterium]